MVARSGFGSPLPIQSAVQVFVIQNAVAHDEVLGPLWQKRREF